MNETAESKSIDITPTWAGLLPLLLAAITDGTDKGGKVAREELARMAEAADRWNAHCKAEKAGDA